MYLIVGLGNPGTQYLNTHHNAGFTAVEKLADASREWKSEHKSLTQKVLVAGEEVILAKPQTFMNLSGEAVQALMTWYKIKPENLLVFSDDVNLDVGRIRIRSNGSHGGQNGLRNIIEHIGDRFPRVRFGVGKCPPKWDLANWVLSKFPPEDKPIFEEAISKVPALVECYFRFGMGKCMERYNGK
ncbi:peptidyl-tRNA hydrolase, PTH1 family [Fibrobacter intestinalis]|uniref:Peptidyl-tRNA hydrolase n=1 Tax=Fibrobacter intestinalis TaxID=28122 RepID=A0A1M6STB7_9BACT|nr:aminoacyl-tRNA hydrolase [Fibrobacter intestinalis]SHK47818.1 peptidyl-tRNA hydrolase, PTH1 family [Fibrobacter intestinalis]